MDRVLKSPPIHKYLKQIYRNESNSNLCSDIYNLLEENGFSVMQISNNELVISKSKSSPALSEEVIKNTIIEKLNSDIDFFLLFKIKKVKKTYHLKIKRPIFM